MMNFVRIVAVTALAPCSRDIKSKAGLEQFMKQVTSSEGRQSRIGDEIAGEALVAIDPHHRWEFTTEDLVAAAELSDEELE